MFTQALVDNANNTSPTPFSKNQQKKLEHRLIKGVEIDQLFCNKFSILPLKAIFLDNMLILQRIIIEMSHRFQQPFIVPSRRNYHGRSNFRQKGY